MLRALQLLFSQWYSMLFYQLLLLHEIIPIYCISICPNNIWTLSWDDPPCLSCWEVVLGISVDSCKHCWHYTEFVMAISHQMISEFSHVVLSLSIDGYVDQRWNCLSLCKSHFISSVSYVDLTANGITIFEEEFLKYCLWCNTFH